MSPRKGPQCFQGGIWLTQDQAHLLTICVREAFLSVDAEDKELTQDFKQVLRKVERMEREIATKADIYAARAPMRPISGEPGSPGAGNHEPSLTSPAVNKELIDK